MVALASCAALATAALPSSAAAAAPLQHAAKWKVQATAQPPKVPGSTLVAISCSAGSACMAVGSEFSDTVLGADIKPLAELRSGGHWGIRPVPLPAGDTGVLRGVSCTSSRWCMAVGFHGHGRQPDGLAEIWNGIRWRLSQVRQVSGRVNTELTAVSCTAPNACIAAGDFAGDRGLTKVLAEKWNGTKWRMLPAQQPARSNGFAALNGISCTSPDACIAVGSSITRQGAEPLAERWNGAAWRIEKVPSRNGSPGAELSAVACTSPAACTAVGINVSKGDTTIAVRWNGARWMPQSTPNLAAGPAHGDSLTSVACPSARSCVAVGIETSGPGDAPFAESWNDGRWTLQSVPHPAGGFNPGLAGVSCTQASCVAVGGFQVRPDNSRSWAATKAR